MSDCEHSWEPASSPLDAPFTWYRCARKGCGVIGFARKPWFRRRTGSHARAPTVTPYRCTTVGCKRHAVERVPGRGAGGSYIWACADHRRRE